MNAETNNTFGSLNLGGFGSNLPNASVPAPSTKLVNAPANDSVSKTNNAEIAKSIASDTKPSDKPAANMQSISNPAQSETEGMAARFEDVYLRVSKDIEKLSKIEKTLSQVTAEGGKGSTKSLDHLGSLSTQWKETDIEAFGNLLNDLTKKFQEDQPSVENKTQVVRSIIAETTKFGIKKEEIQDLSNRNIDSTNGRLNNQKLGEETKLELNLLERRADAFGTMVNSLEFSVMESTKRSIIQEESLSSYYSFNKKICEIQSELKFKDKKLVDLEEKIAHIRLADISRKACQNSVGFSCVDLSDSEEEEEEKDISDAVQYTTKHIRRFNFFNALYESTSQRAPLSFNKQE